MQPMAPITTSRVHSPVRGRSDDGREDERDEAPASLAAGASKTQRRPHLGIVILAVLLLGLTVWMGFGIPHRHGMEELGVANAVYTFAFQGRMAFPIYGEYFFDSFGIHPHTHYATLGWLLRLGLDLASAEAIPICAMVLLASLVILRSVFPNYVKAGLLFGMYSTIVLAAGTLPDHAFGVRPELYFSLVWITGLITIDSSRLGGYTPRLLFLGSLLLSYASCLQNFGLLAFTGLGVYQLGILRTGTWSQAFRRLGLVVTAFAVVAIPFALLYVIPNRTMIRANASWGVNHAAPLAKKLSTHAAVHEGFSATVGNEFKGVTPTVSPVLLATNRYVPHFVMGMLALACFSSTRRLALAALPVPFVIMWTLPKAQYFVAEFMLFNCGFWCLASGLCFRVSRFCPDGWNLRRVGFAAAVGLAALGWWGTPLLRQAATWSPADHEMDVARAAAKQIVGDDALVTSRHLAWYISGAAKWHRLETDLTEPAELGSLDLTSYASQFDALADYFLFSAATQSGHTPATMCALGQIQLRGFFLSPRLPGIPIFFFGASRPAAVKGFFRQENDLFRFDETPDGDCFFVSYRGPTALVAIQDRDLSDCALIRHMHVLDLPAKSSLAGSCISAFIVSKHVLKNPRLAWLNEVDVLNKVAGTVTRVDAGELVAQLRRTDRPIEFMRTPLDEKLKVFVGKKEPTHPLSTAPPAPPDQPVGQSGIGSGSLYNSADFVPDKALDGNPATAWRSERLGSRVRYRSFIGIDCGLGEAKEIKQVLMQQSADSGSTIDSAILLVSDDKQNWHPVAVLALPPDDRLHAFHIAPAGRHRFWKLLANGNPERDRAWTITELRLLED